MSNSDHSGSSFSWLAWLDTREVYILLQQQIVVMRKDLAINLGSDESSGTLGTNELESFDSLRCWTAKT